MIIGNFLQFHSTCMIPHLYWIHTCFQLRFFLGQLLPSLRITSSIEKKNGFLFRNIGPFTLNMTKRLLSSIIRVCWLMSCVRTYSLISIVILNPSNFLSPSIHVLSLAMYFYIIVHLVCILYMLLTSIHVLSLAMYFYIFILTLSAICNFH